jgi:hypothetical protein
MQEEKMHVINRNGAAAAMLLALSSAVACQDIIGELGEVDDDPSSDTGTDVDAGSGLVCGWEKTVDPVGSMLTDVWGNGAGDVVAVGGHTALHFDGEEWQPLTEEPAPMLSMLGIWGESITELFVVGFDTDYTGQVARFDGTDWTAMETAHLNPALLGAVWGSSSSDVYAVGPGTQSMYEGLLGGSKVIRFDGEEWSAVEEIPAQDTETRFLDVWGSGPADVFVLGEAVMDDETIVFHFDGVEWSKMPTNENWTYPGVIFGVGSQDVFLSTAEWSTSKCVSRFDGTEWNDFASCFDYTADQWLLQPKLRGMWGADPGRLYAIDGDQDVWSISDSEWSLELKIDPKRDDERDYFAQAIWGSATDDIYVVGNAIWHYGCK